MGYKRPMSTCDECKKPIDLKRGWTVRGPFDSREVCVSCADALDAAFFALPADPPIKWVGGKRQLLPEIRKYVPASFGTYYEPFLGGAALFFALQPERAVLSDLNDNLITMYKALRDIPKSVVELLTSGEYPPAREHYEQVVRPRNMREGGAARRAADFLYLNRYGFNGLYRENKSGQFNVPYGDNPKAHIDMKNLQRVSNALQGKTILREPFQAVLETAKRGDFVYFDPPYVPLSDTSDFTAYQGEGFNMADQIRLRDTALLLHERGVHVLLSNSSAPEVYQIYADFRITEVRARRSVNSKADKRGEVTEVLIRPPSRLAYAFV